MFHVKHRGARSGRPGRCHKSTNRGFLSQGALPGVGWGVMRHAYPLLPQRVVGRVTVTLKAAARCASVLGTTVPATLEVGALEGNPDSSFPFTAWPTTERLPPERAMRGAAQSR